MKERYEVDIEVSKYTYDEGASYGGFTVRNWSLVIKDIKTGGTKNFYLGQDAKVTSRILGMNIGDAVTYYAEKTGSREFDKVKKAIAEDIVLAVTEGASDVQEAAKKLFKEAQPWEIAAE